jgi:hypothetical protein
MIHFAFGLLYSYLRSIQPRLMDFFNANMIDSICLPGRLERLPEPSLLTSLNRTQLVSFADD